MGTLLHGKDLKIIWGGDTIAISRSCEISHDCETIEIASPTSGNTKEYIPGRKSWTVTCSWLVSKSDWLDQILKVGEKYNLKMDRNNQGLIGKAILKSCKITATKGNLAQGSFTFQGSEELSEYEIPT